MTTRLSQAALYGEVLTNEQQYRKEVMSAVPLSREEQSILIKRAKQGEKQAKSELVTHMLPRIFSLASRYARLSEHTETSDFCQMASVAMLERFEKALEKPEPCAYLYGIARLAMREYSSYNESLISKQSHPDCNEPDYTVVSLDVSPTNNEDDWSDLLEAPGTTCLEDPEKKYPSLYTALYDLPSGKSRLAIFYRYGVCGHPHHTLEEIEHLLMGQQVSTKSAWKAANARSYIGAGLKALKTRLERSPIRCEGCGKEFLPRRSNQKSHNLACANKKLRLRKKQTLSCSP